jgi:hypothetical protein
MHLRVAVHDAEGEALTHHGCVVPHYLHASSSVSVDLEQCLQHQRELEAAPRKQLQYLIQLAVRWQSRDNSANN